jgi:Ca-activated chloride channel homolog
VKRLLTSVMIALSVGVVLGGAQQQSPTFRGTSDTVRVFVTVLDRNGRLVTSLSQDNFEVRDDGKVQPVAVFDNTPQPIQIVVMLDVSGSMAGNLALLRASSTELFKSLGQEDVARVGSFGREIEISEVFTRDLHELEDALPDDIPVNAPTPLWRAIDQAMDSFDANSERRRVVLVLSDGKNSDVRFSKRNVSQVEIIDRASAEGVMVYAVGLRSRSMAPPQFGGGLAGMSGSMNGDRPDPGLALTAEETGGGYVEVRPRDDLSATFTRIVKELHSQYLLGYNPPKRDGKAHKIEVRVSADGLEPRARKSYVAPKEAK